MAWPVATVRVGAWTGGFGVVPADVGLNAFDGVGAGALDGVAAGVVDGAWDGVAAADPVGPTDDTIIDTAQGAGDDAFGAGVGAGWHAPTVGDAEDGPEPVGDVVGSAAFGAGGNTFTCWVAYCGAAFTC
ncbi:MULTISPECIES: hypothetical protein [unclassified Frankia]|uniref:hypothetical protein n=1 Tax=unclassified Frankia TaxID=2632575 RepID=UPI002AD4F431|nr:MULTISPECIES: hypothetical protein [unclassified Frankia]